MLHVLNLLDTCSQKFGAVCITIHSFIFLGGVLIFDFLSMVIIMNIIKDLWNLYAIFF